MRHSGTYDARARELAIASGTDPDSRIPNPEKPGKTMPAWVSFREAAQKEELAAITGGETMPLRKGASPFTLNIDIGADGSDERDNVVKVTEAMNELMRIPTTVDGVVMPDACPAGVIPVGGVVATKEAIHPGFHSADICCSMAITVFQGSVDPTTILDAGMELSHFGVGGRADMPAPEWILQLFDANRFLSSLTKDANTHFGTQGDGNHFFYVGRIRSTGDIALVTHHGSRGPGASLYKKGMECAEKWRRKLSPETPREAAWIPSETDDGRDYWDALQIIRQWTKHNHYAIHNAIVARLGHGTFVERFWNEHNFIFRKPDGLFYHAKGATPAFSNWAVDATNLTLIPLNMREPILITRGMNAPNGLGFAPHGAGRNFSRTGYMKRNAHLTEAEMVAEQTKGIDARFFSGIPDVSELPDAYKDAKSVIEQINAFKLAEIVDYVDPVGSIMAGNSAWWQKKKLVDKAS